MKTTKLTYEEKKAKRKGEHIFIDPKYQKADMRSYVRNFKSKK